MPKVCPVCNGTYPDANVFCPADGTTLRAAVIDGDLIGSVVADRYLVTDLLGEGGMGKVYLARHVRLPQQAAIKVLHPDMVRDPASVARFNREASNASRIDDDHVARVYDFGETSDGTVYLAMEYVAGRTLRALIEAEGPLPPARTVSIVRQIAEGLDAAHHLRIIHRDLKPDNVLVVTTPDGRDRVKVVDFGIAKAFGADAGGGALTKTGFIVGTPEFMSPEQLLGGALDARSDVYALALVAYQCLTGDLPFPTDTPDHGMAARLMTPARALKAVRPDVPWTPELQAVFDVGLSREPEERPAVATQFARMLADAIPDTAASRTAIPLPPRPSPTEAKAASAAPKPAPGAPGSPAAAAAATPPVAPPVPTPTRSRAMPAIAGTLALVAIVGAGAFFLMNRGAPAAPQAAAAPVPADSASGPTPRGESTPPAPAPRSANTTRRGSERAGTTTAAAPPTAAVSSPSPAPSAAPVARAPEPTLSTEAADRAYAAGQTLDSLARVLQRSNADASTARAVGSAIRALMPRLAGDDRVRAQIRLIDASALSGDAPGACAALRAAQAASTTAAQRAEVRKYDEQLGCS